MLIFQIFCVCQERWKIVDFGVQPFVVLPGTRLSRIRAKPNPQKVESSCNPAVSPLTTIWSLTVQGLNEPNNPGCREKKTRWRGNRQQAPFPSQLTIFWKLSGCPKIQKSRILFVFGDGSGPWLHPNCAKNGDFFRPEILAVDSPNCVLNLSCSEQPFGACCLLVCFPS